MTVRLATTSGGNSLLVLEAAGAGAAEAAAGAGAGAGGEAAVSAVPLEAGTGAAADAGALAVPLEATGAAAAAAADFFGLETITTRKSLGFTLHCSNVCASFKTLPEYINFIPAAVISDRVVSIIVLT